nr:YolD-like family protein [Bacillus safensis]
MEEFEYTIATAMSEDLALNFDLFDNGFVREITGKVGYVGLRMIGATQTLYGL